MAQTKGISLASKTLVKDRYRIKELLENSGLTLTYLAYDTFRDKKIVLKELCPEKLVERTDGQYITCRKLSDEAVFEEMKEEMISQAKKMIKLFPLSGITNVISYIEENKTVYIISEYIEGLTLERFLNARKAEKLLLDSLTVFFAPFMDALEKLHEAGVIHGKIRPDQIIVTKNNGAVLTGFCEPISALVKPAFMEDVIPSRNSRYAPVELFMKSEIKLSVDVYGLASTIYHCITGKVPPNFYDRIQNTDTLQPPWDMGIELTSEQSKAVTKAMASHAFERTQTIKQLRKGLQPEVGKAKAPAPIVLYHTPFVFHKIDIYKNRKRIFIAAVICCLLLFLMPKAAGAVKESRINHFYHKFSTSSLYEQCTILRGMSAGKRSAYVNDYTRLTEGDKFNKIKYYNLNKEKYFLRSEVDFSERNYSFLTIDYRDSARAVVTFYQKGEEIIYDINLLRQDGEFKASKAIIKDGIIKGQEDLTIKP